MRRYNSRDKNGENFYTFGTLQAFLSVPASSRLLTSLLQIIAANRVHHFSCVTLTWSTFLSWPLCPLERKCHMESITKQNRKVLCIDPEKCTVIIKYIILHSHVDCVSFFARHKYVLLSFHLRDTSLFLLRYYYIPPPKKNMVLDETSPLNVFLNYVYFYTFL